VLHLRQIDAHRQAEETVDLAHPVRVALREVIVDGDDMYALAGQRIQVRGQRCHQGLAFARTHFGDLALMQRNGSHELHIEVAHS